ncbi:MAG: hypothetical protein Kow0042_01710 [Calditrichia bacterium]
MFIFGLSGNSFAGQWSLNAGIQAFSGNYIYTQNTSVYYMTGGIRYRTPGWNLSLSVPFIAQNSSSVTNMGGMFFPNNENAVHGDAAHWNMHGRQTSETLTTHHMSFALADMYVYGERQVLAENGTLPAFSLVGQVKFPTASVQENYGTGEYDYSVGAAFRKSVYPFVLSFDISYFRIGDPAGITYQDPVILGVGVGKFFLNGRLSVLAYYHNYSRILSDYDPPRQVTFGGYYKLSQQLFLSGSTLFGLSNTSPDLGLAMAIEVGL